MAQFTSYLAPTVTTDVVYEQGGVSFYGDARIPVLIGEGQETRTLSGIEMHRGSSATADDLRVGESLTAQVDGVTRSFTLSYGPVVSGDGTGTVTSDPTKIQVYTLDAQLNKVPLRVVSLNGATRNFQLADILLQGSPLYATYSFKRTDTKILNEDLSDQIPSFSTLTLQGVTLKLSQPGFSSTNVTLALTLAASGKTDAQAVSGNGSDVISIELRRSDNTIRTNYDLLQLINAGINTASGGQILYVAPTVGDPIVLAAAPAAHFSGGNGQNTNTTFKVKSAPVVDGTNGGVVTNLPSKIQVTVNGVPAQVVALDGASGLFTLAQGVTDTSRLKATYYTNTYQDTFDILPNASAVKALNVGFAPGRNDFQAGVDYLLGTDGNIYWGNAAILKKGVATPGYVPFDSTAVQTSLMDERMFLRPCSGVVDGVNASFILPDVPCDGSGLGIVTDNPLLINVYYGTDPVDAYRNGAVRVTRLTGAKGQFTLFNPPPASTSASPVKVYATYWRNVMGNHSFTAEVLVPGGIGQGTYRLADGSGNPFPALRPGTHSITQANAAVTGLIWPSAKSDLRGVAGKTPDEVVTLTFQDDGASVATPAVQAANTTAAPGILFRANTPTSYTAANSTKAEPVDNGKPSVQLVSKTPVADNAAVTVDGQVISININRDTTDAARQTRTLGEIVELVNAAQVTDTANTLGGLIASMVTGWDPNAKAQAGHCTGFTGGAAATTTSASTRFKVTSSRTTSDVAADGLGMTGGATTVTGAPGSISTVGAEGFLGQTFEDPNTGVTFTLVDPSLAFETNPNAATDYGFTTCPSPAYQFQPGDKVTFVVSHNGVHGVSASPNLSLYGMKLTVPSTYGMRAGDTLAITTHDRTGSEPKVGEFYYMDLVVEKTEAELATVQFFTSDGPLYNATGAALPENKASLGGKLMFDNGATLIAVLQVKKDEGQLIAGDATYMDAIASLRKALPGVGRKANVIVPMTTSESVIRYLSQHLNTQASPRNKGEAIGFIGLPQYTSHSEAQALATSLNSERLILTYPGGAIVTLEQNGSSLDYAVGGEFLAAALAGLFLNPANDVATDLTLQHLTGIKGLISTTEEPIMDLLAQSGVTVLTDSDSGVEIRQYVTTSTDSVLRVEPYVTTTVDFVRQRTRTELKEFIAKKNVKNRLTDIAVKANALMAQFVTDEILSGFKPATVKASATDPRVVDVSIPINPMMSILWINVTFQVSIDTKG